MPLHRNFFSFFELKIASFCAFLVLFFVSSSTTDGLLRNDLSGGPPSGGDPGPWPPGPP